MFGENILSKIPADWQITNGYMTSGIIALNANGSATQILNDTDIASIPESFLVTIIANNYVNTYAPFAYVQLHIITADNQEHFYNVPIIDSGSGFCVVTVPVLATEYSFFSFTIRTYRALVISDWALATPIVDDVNLDEIKEEIPKLLADYNTSTYAIGQREENIALISARLLANTDVSGHLQLEYDALQSCTITIRIKDNTGTELFAPLLYDVKVGKGSIGVPHAFLTRLAGNHTFSVTAQCSTGTVIFYTRGILFTIDAGYLATRIMDIDTDLQDIALQQLSSDDTPSSIFAIGVDKDGIVRVRRRAYSENALVAWEPVYEYEAGIRAAIEFDGTWVRRLGDEFFTLECEAVPWCFWITASGDLIAQKGIEESTRITLSTGVSKLSVVRGFKSSEYITQDQGIVVMYLKEGRAFYRNYCTQENESVVWELERELLQLGEYIEDVHVHRLNDYRLGFVSSSTVAGNKWAITKRTYVAAAVPPEYIDFNVARHWPSLAVVPVEQQDYIINFVTSYSEDHKYLYVTFDYPVIVRNSLDTLFKISSSVPIKIKNAIANGNVLELELETPVRSAFITITPQHDFVCVYMPNAGYIRLTQGWYFEIAMYASFTESIAFSAAGSATVLQKYLATLGHTQTESVAFSVTHSTTAIQKYLQDVFHSHTESISFSVAYTVVSAVSFVGTEPI